MAKKLVVKKKLVEEAHAPAEELAGDIDVIETYPIREPFSSIRITYNRKTHEYLYEVTEEKLNEKEQEIMQFVKGILSRTLEYELEQTLEARRKRMEEQIKELISVRGIKIAKSSLDKISYYVTRDFAGYGKVDPIMNDTMIEDISCDGVNIPIFLYHRVYESIKTNVKFETDEELDSFIISLVQKCGKQISVAEPLLDGTLPDGSRLQSALAREVTTRGGSFTIRRFRENPLTPPDLIRFNTTSAEMMAYLWLGVENGDSMLMCGGTACGKTSTMNAVMLFIPSHMKIVSIEDTREINIPHENWIAGLTRTGFGGKLGESTLGEIDMFELMKAALRQRPQYLIVGEIRGAEAFTLFQAMATGHTTYSTMHADSVRSIVHRLENPPINLPRILLAALNIVVLQSQVMLGDRMVRRINKIVEVVGIDPDTNDIIANTVYEWDPAEDNFKFLGHSVMLEKIASKKSLTVEQVKEELRKRNDVMEWLTKKNIRHYKEVANAISSYYKDPTSLIKKVREELYGGTS
ncbi:MAG: type II/IV secretion system ATPase subunit [Candidatus Thermoplasmatota archaeon]|nr:type II/IV secretion system ATPase subunit [Candidatus Thermoplasmatota archaeon]